MKKETTSTPVIFVDDLETITIIDKNIGKGISISHNGKKILHVEKLIPADWGEY